MAAAIPYVLMAGGTLMSMKAQQQQADDQRSILNRQLARDEDTSKKASQMVLDEGNYYDPTARKQAMAEQETKAYDTSMADLKAGAGGGDPAAVNTSSDAGNVSDDFVKSKAERAITEGTRLTGIAAEIAKTRAPTLLLGQEGLRSANLATNLQTMFGSNSNMATASKNDAKSVEEPEYGGLGQIASKIGTSMIAGDIGKKYATQVTFPRGTPMFSNSGSGVNWDRA